MRKDCSRLPLRDPSRSRRDILYDHAGQANAREGSPLRNLAAVIHSRLRILPLAHHFALPHSLFAACVRGHTLLVCRNRTSDSPASPRKPLAVLRCCSDVLTPASPWLIAFRQSARRPGSRTRMRALYSAPTRQNSHPSAQDACPAVYAYAATSALPSLALSKIWFDANLV